MSNTLQNAFLLASRLLIALMFIPAGAIVGGLLALAAAGASAWSIDGRRRG